MDNFKKASNLIKEYYKYQNDGNAAALIQEVCGYFDMIKNEKLSQSEIKFLISFANLVGVPQYIDLLKQKYQKDKFEVDNLDLSTLGAYISESSLQIDEDNKLHKYQKQVLDRFTKNMLNRYILSAPTSFGKTFLVYQIIKKMGYSNIVLIFPTISLLSENYVGLMSGNDVNSFFAKYSIHSLSDDNELGAKNIWIYTPERFLSYIDRNREMKFDFVFIDEIYKIDNEYIIDEETTGESERDTAYRIALEYACREAGDMLLAGPYMEIPEQNTANNKSFLNFVEDKSFEILNYNEYEIVNKTVDSLKGKAFYDIDGITIKIGKTSVYEKVANIIIALTSPQDNTIVYNNFKAGTERYAKELISLLQNEIDKWNEEFSEDSEAIYRAFVSHLERLFGSDWIIVEALKNKIGIHHGLVPKYIQKEIIELFNNGMLCVLISTTTITEGVNTTAKNMIITSNKKGRKALRHFDAKNIAGRAGRFLHHYSGRVIVVDNKFKETLENENDQLKHRNFDLSSTKSDIDYPITSEKYLSAQDIADRYSLEQEILKRQIPDDIINQFKVISPRDKIIVLDRIYAYSDSELKQVKELIRKLNTTVKIDWDGFQLVLDTIEPVVKDKKLLQMIQRHCKDKDGGDSKYSILTAKTHFYLIGGFFGLLDYNLKDDNKNAAIRETADLVYNVFKYQLVKYLGIFDLMFKFIRSKKENKDFDSVVGISVLLKKLEYNALTNKARILSDFGVPFKLVEYYENDNNLLQKKFDAYETYVDEKIKHLLK